MRAAYRIFFSTALAALASMLLLPGCSDDEKVGFPGEENLRTGSAPDTGGDDATLPNDAGSSADLGLASDAEVECVPSAPVRCEDDRTAVQCNAEGSGVVRIDCGTDYCFQGECGPNLCMPGAQQCADPQTVEFCNAAGDGYENPMPCPANTVCEEGSCKALCDLGGKGPSYIGCEYWTVDLDQYTDPFTNPKPDEVPHAVVISNPGPADATVAFVPRRAGVMINVPDPVVKAGEARSFEMPRLDVDGSSVTSNAIQILSSSPVTAHQFNPLNNESVYSNDASLLLPVSALGREYYVLNWPTQVIPGFMGNDPDDQHAYVTVIATETGTTNLNVTSTARVVQGPQVPNFEPGFPRSFQLLQGQVLNVQVNSGQLGPGLNDLSGTHIIADRAIAVFAGHEEAVIGDSSIGRDSCCADHLEQQLFPVEAWGNVYVAAHSPDRGDHQDHWKIVSAEDGVTVTFDPPQAQGSVTLDAGEIHSFYSKESFMISATGKVSVGQFLVSQQQTLDVVGDPAFILAVPTNQYREDYTVLTPNGYSRDYITLIRPAGTAVRLDGTAVAENAFQAVGSAGWEVATVPVNAGVHSVDADAPVGLLSYGFDSAVSYGYPGGLNLIGVDERAP